MKENIPQYLLDMKVLQEHGGNEKIAELVENQADVWIKRSSGAWQKAKAIDVTHGGRSVTVQWENPDHPEKPFEKRVRAVEFLHWQNEAPKENE